MRIALRLISLIQNALINVLTMILNLFIWRSDKIWLFGAWMGTKFADNPRFLFQYLHENKEKYDIKKVVWVTRDKSLCREISAMGYECYMMHSVHSYYYHIRAKVHVICNMYAKTGSYLGDILGNLSSNAIKIQLWHGVGIKACGGLASNSIKKDYRNKTISRILASPLFLPGGWKKKAYFLATSNENKRVAIYDHGYPENNIIIGIYPRLCDCQKNTNYEAEVLLQLQKAKRGGKRIVLNLPTFREKDAYVEPMQIPDFASFLENNDILWIEKKHSADKNRKSFTSGNNIMGLPNWFDVNVLWKHIDLLVSDYSSATSDAIYNKTCTLDYCPDYEDYKTNDRGFVAPYGEYHISNVPVVDWNNLEEEILIRLLNPEKYMAQTERVKLFLFGELQPDYGTLVETIITKVGINNPKKGH